MSSSHYPREKIIAHLLSNGYKLSVLQPATTYEVYTRQDSLPVRLYRHVISYDRSELKEILPQDVELSVLTSVN